MGQREDLYRRGVDLLDAFRQANPRVDPVHIEVDASVNASFGVCAYYRSDVIRIDVHACALIGTAGPRTFEALRDTFTPVEARTWDRVIESERQIEAARRKIEKAARPRRPSRKPPTPTLPGLKGEVP